MALLPSKLPMRSSIVYAFERYLIFLCAGSFCCHFFFSLSAEDVEQHGTTRRKKNANLVLRLPIRITTENPAWDHFYHRNTKVFSPVQCLSFLEWNYPGMKRNGIPKMLPERCSRVCYLIRFSAPFWELSVMMCRRSCIVLIDLSGMSAREGRKEKVSIVSTIREPEWRASSLSRISRSRWEMKSRNSEFKLQL